MPRATFMKIPSCLHPDRSMSDKTLNEAFDLFKKLEHVLCKKAKPQPRRPRPPAKAARK